MKGNDVSTEQQSEKVEKEADVAFISGYFGQRIERGERPRQGYPENHLPAPQVASMELQTSFMAH